MKRHLSNILTVFRKELRDLLRDRRTIMSMIVVPLLLMPGLMLTTLSVANKVINRARSTPPTVVIVGGQDSPKTRAALAANRRIRVVDASPDWKQRITDKKIRAAVEIPANFDAALETGEPVQVTIYNYEGEMRSSFAVGELRRFFTDYREQLVSSRLAARGLPASLVRPFDISTRNVAPPEKVGGNAFGGMVPYFFLLLSFTGAMYPAMDLTAGEKERGTMETILCSPVPRIDLVLGKFLMVLTASLATVACSLTSGLLTLTLAGAALGGAAPAVAAGALPPGAPPMGGAPIPSIDPIGLVASVAMVIPMAVLFAAVQFTISLFAKSFKEAQSYVSPLVVVIILPAVIGMLPGVELNPRLALVPILNVSLVSKELVSGIWHWDLIALIFGSTCVYAAAALALAVRMFNREDVIFRT
jgi:sodium transport system permease protein